MLRFTAVAVVLLLGCTSNKGAPAPPPPPPDLRAVGDTGVSFRRQVLPVLVKHCAAAGGCHGDSGARRVGIDLRESTALAALRDRPSRERIGWVLVSPGQPERSFLVDKMTGQLGKNEGSPMPLDPDTGMVVRPSPIEPFIAATLIPWIREGAQDN